MVWDCPPMKGKGRDKFELGLKAWQKKNHVMNISNYYNQIKW